MAISDHAISNRAISAPADSVVVGVSAPGRCVGRSRAVNECEAFDAPAGDALGADGWAGLVEATGAGAGSAAGTNAPAGAVTAGSFPI